MPIIEFADSVVGLLAPNFVSIFMNPNTGRTGSVHYIHLADPSEEDEGKYEESKIKTRSDEENSFVTTLTLLASRGMITNQECAQLTEFAID